MPFNFLESHTNMLTFYFTKLEKQWLLVCTLSTLLIWTKNFYQRIPPGTLKVVWILLNPTEFAQKIDLLIKVPDVVPSTVEKMRSLKICQIKKITLPGEQTFWDRQLCFYVKKWFVSETRMNENSFQDHEMWISRIVLIERIGHRSKVAHIFV